jgi:hypothetical protein
MNKAIILLLVLLLVITLPAEAQAQEDGELDLFRFQLYTFIETKIVVSYEFTQNVTSDAYSAGNTLWQMEVAPLTTVFSTNARDRFIFTVEIAYTMKVSQAITVAVFSGSGPVDNMELKARGKRVVLEFEVNVTEEPEYPTAEELAQMSVEVLENKLAEYVAEMRTENRIGRWHITVQWILIAVVFVAFIIVTVLPHLKHPQKGE